MFQNRFKWFYCTCFNFLKISFTEQPFNHCNTHPIGKQVSESRLLGEPAQVRYGMSIELNKEQRSKGGGGGWGWFNQSSDWE